MVPDRGHLAQLKTCNLVKLLNLEGRYGGEKKFQERDRVVSSERLPIWEGIEPLNWQTETFRYSSFESLPMRSGKAPENWLVDISK